MSNTYVYLSKSVQHLYQANRLSYRLKVAQDSLAEWSKAPDLGSGPKGRGFKSHSCQQFYFNFPT